MRGITLDVRAGEIVAIAGVAGNGQRELAETITGMRAPTQGTVRVAGKEVSGPAIHAGRSNAGVAFVPEDRLGTGAAPGLSIASNLVLRSYRDRSVSRGPLLLLDRIRRRAIDLIARYRISAPGPNAAVRVLSGGNLQKVVIAREFSGSPRVVVAASSDAGPRRRSHRDCAHVPPRGRRWRRGCTRLLRGPRGDPRARRPDRGDLRGARSSASCPAKARASRRSG